MVIFVQFEVKWISTKLNSSFAKIDPQPKAFDENQ